MFSGRTDMAIERHARLKDTLAEGLDIHRESEGDLDISVITVKAVSYTHLTLPTT